MNNKIKNVVVLAVSTLTVVSCSPYPSNIKSDYSDRKEKEVISIAGKKFSIPKDEIATKQNLNQPATNIATDNYAIPAAGVNPNMIANSAAKVANQLQPSAKASTILPVAVQASPETGKPTARMLTFAEYQQIQAYQNGNYLPYKPQAPVYDNNQSSSTSVPYTRPAEPVKKPVNNIADWHYYSY